MLDSKDFARDLRIDTDRLEVFIDRGWISPLVLGEARQFREIDFARAALIVDLATEFGVNDDGIDVALDLLDQLYGLRLALSIAIDALEDRRRLAATQLVASARRNEAPIRRRAHDRHP